MIKMMNRENSLDVMRAKIRSKELTSIDEIFLGGITIDSRIDQFLELTDEFDSHKMKATLSDGLVDGTEGEMQVLNLKVLKKGFSVELLGTYVPPPTKVEIKDYGEEDYAGENFIINRVYFPQR